MSNKQEGTPEFKPEDRGTAEIDLRGERGFEIITKLGSIEGLLEGLLTRTKENRQETSEQHITTLDKIKNLTIPTMAAKNNLSFSGRGNESATELIKQLKTLQLANGWDDSRMVGQCLATLKDEARAWYEEIGLEAFCDVDTTTPKFKNFEEKFLEKFKEDISQSDLLYELLNCKQERGQSVDEYLSSLCSTLSKLKDLSEEVKCGMVINGFVPYIRDNLKLKEIKTMKDLEKWSRRLQKLTHIQKASVCTLDDEQAKVETVDSQEEEVVIHKQPVRAPQTASQTKEGKKSQGFQRRENRPRQWGQGGRGQPGGNRQGRQAGACFGCGSRSHYVADCPQRQGQYNSYRQGQYNSRYGRQNNRQGQPFRQGDRQFQASYGMMGQQQLN